MFILLNYLFYFVFSAYLIYSWSNEYFLNIPNTKELAKILYKLYDCRVNVLDIKLLQYSIVFSNNYDQIFLI